jgi:excisionase family DNA binding protein
MDPIYVTVTEAAELIGVSRAKAYEYITSGEWPSVKLGRLRKIPYMGLIEWSEQQTGKTQSFEAGTPATRQE